MYTIDEKTRAQSTGNMGIGNMIDKLRNGLRCRRAGWNGKGMYVFLINEWGLAEANPHAGTYQEVPFIAMKTADDKVVPWLASQTDILAQDWETAD